MKTLVIDVSNLAYRRFYTMGDLSYNEIPTGVIYGFFKDILALEEFHNSDRFVFCFDGGYKKRTEIYPEYKQNRKKEGTEEQNQAFKDLFSQLDKLRSEYLPEIGFKNIFWQRDYEADDLIAMVSIWNKDNDEIILVSTDNDLYQLLGRNVWIWNPVKKFFISETYFRNMHGISPLDWASVKALAGCSSDGIPGLPGIGEKTAIKFMQGNLKKTTDKYETIKEGCSDYRKFIKITTLPMNGTMECHLQEDEVTKEKWEKVADKLGMKSLFKGKPKGIRSRRTQ